MTSLVSDLTKRYDDPADGSTPAEPLLHARLHDLRHVHATTLLLAGVAVHVVAARLGQLGSVHRPTGLRARHPDR
ncbi:hypothetical protein [Actinocorallia longicatena]|uniref:hypothetical protein n=1 Tax=Actinocorallia longicatena TaxID=111803 RepID=UPI0031E3E933